MIRADERAALLAKWQSGFWTGVPIGIAGGLLIVASWVIFLS